MECKNCKWWFSKIESCTDPHDWYNKDGEDVCRYEEGAMNFEQYNDYLAKHNEVKND